MPHRIAITADDQTVDKLRHRRQRFSSGGAGHHTLSDERPMLVEDLKKIVREIP